jgi:hypothetical protein
VSAKTHEILTFDQKEHYGWLVWCPACAAPHNFDKRWTFDGDHEAPTFVASMLVHESPGHPRCHSMLTKGVWNYLGDSTHDKACTSVPAPNWADCPFGRMRPDGVVPPEQP